MTRRSCLFSPRICLLRWFASADGAMANVVAPIIPKQITAVTTVFRMLPEKTLELLVIAFSCDLLTMTQTQHTVAPSEVVLN